MRSGSRYRPSPSKNESEDAWISDLDPIVEGGFKVVFNQLQFPVEVRTTDEEGQPISIKELYTIRILAQHTTQGLNEIKVQLSSEQDLFKVYICKVDDKIFEKIKKCQHLNYPFTSLIQMLIKQIQLCQKNINQYTAVLFLNKISAHRLDLLQNIQYKRIELLSLEFDELDEEGIKNYVTFRFTKVKMNKQIIQKKLTDVISMTKLKNQSLWADIVKKQTMRVPR